VKQLRYDVLVVGSGASGAAAAETAARLGARVLVLSKDPIACSDTKISEGIMTVCGSASASDSEQALAQNMRMQGDDLAEPALVKAFAQDSRGSYNWLLKQGIAANLNSATGRPEALSLALGGHSHPRSVDHHNGGLDFAHACWNALNSGTLDYLEDAWFIDLYRHDERVIGGLVYLAAEGCFASVLAPAVVLACGGVSTLYFPNTDTMKGNTGDAYAIAARAGAQLIDMEQVQFIPFAIAQPSTYQGLIVGEPAVAGALGVLRDAHGVVIQSELAGRTRAACSAAIIKAVAQGRGTANGGCYLDLTENRQGKAGERYVALIQEKVPGLLKTVKGALGPAAAKFAEPWEVRPSAHYLMGGIRTSPEGEALDTRGQVIPGLLAAGQAMGGLHGSNRLGSTSLAEGVIYGQRAGERAAAYVRGGIASPSAETLQACESRALAAFERAASADGQAVLPIIRALQKSAWQGLGPGRTEAGIEATLAEIGSLEARLAGARFALGGLWNQALIDFIECRNLLLCAQAIGRSALHRKRSLGAHVRLDKPALLRRETHGSVGSCWSTEQARIVVNDLPRTRSPLAQRLRVHLQAGLRLGAAKLIRRLPFSWRDRVLFAVYDKALGKEEATS